MKYFLPVLLLIMLGACSDKSLETQSEPYIPELVISDSLVIDNLTKLTLIDVKEDHSEYLFYDGKTNEFLRVDTSGEILVRANRTGDGKDNYKSSSFYAANYQGKDEIMLLTHSEAFLYNPDFSLKKGIPLEFGLITNRIGDNRVAQSYRDYFYTFSAERKDFEMLMESDEFSTSYPFMTLRDLSTLERMNSIKIPAQTQVAINPGRYNNLAPFVQFRGDELYVLFPNSPEIYRYEFPRLQLKNSFNLNPDDKYQQILPQNTEINFDGFFKELAGSQYRGFTFSNDYILTMYEGAAPQNEVDALPRNVVGDERYMALYNKYKSNTYYQIFKNEEKLWEGTWDVNLWIVRDVLYSSFKPGEDPEAIEKDVQTIYFYELK